MAEVNLKIGDRHHAVACRDGEEAQLERLGTMLDQHWDTAMRAAGGLSSERAMLFVALMLADDLDEAQRQPAGGGGVNNTQLDRLAERLERLASALEQSAATS